MTISESDSEAGSWGGIQVVSLCKINLAGQAFQPVFIGGQVVVSFQYYSYLCNLFPEVT